MSILFINDRLSPTEEQFKAIRAVEAEFGSVVVESPASVRSSGVIVIEGFNSEVIDGLALIRWKVNTKGKVVGGWVPNAAARSLTAKYQKGEYRGADN